MPSRENPCVKACMQVLELHGVPHMRNNTGAAIVRRAGGKMGPMSFGKPGWGDIVGCLPDGRFLMVECKAPEVIGLRHKKPAGRASDLQNAVQHQLAASGALVMTVTSSSEMNTALQRAGYFR